jgi:hypothetical protein
MLEGTGRNFEEVHRVGSAQIRESMVAEMSACCGLLYPLAERVLVIWALPPL